MNYAMLSANAQNTAITDDSGYSAHSSAMLDVKSTTKGLLIPRLTTAEIATLTLSSPATGLMVYNSTLNQFMYYNGTSWSTILTPESDTLLSINAQNVYLANPLWNMGIGSTNPSAKLEVKSDITDGIDDPIFAVVNNTGDTVFAVYPQGVRINVIDTSTTKAVSKKGGFAVGGFKPAKGTISKEYFRVTADSVRIYFDENTSKASSSKGGFAVGGYKPSKGTLPYNVFTINQDSAEVFIGDSTAGFGVKNIQGGGSLLNLTANNYFIGHESGIATKGYFNSFFGFQAGLSNVGGNANLFLGFKSGYSNTNGNRNVFIGKEAGFSNTFGFENIFVGNGTGRLNETGYQNLFLGYQSGFNNIGGAMEEGSVNTFLGTLSGYSNTTGFANTFVGHKSGYSNALGKFNTYIGRYAGETSTGDFNVFIGSEAGRFQAGSYKLCINSTQNGFYEVPLIYGDFFDNYVVINGDNPNGKTFFVNGAAGGTSTWAQISDKRYKKDIVTIQNSLEKVMNLRGVNYYWKDKELGEKMQMGFIAQETEKIIPEVVDINDGKYMMSYAPITALLVEAMKEQQKLIEKLQSENSDLKAEVTKIDEMNKKIDELYRLLDIKAAK